MSQCNDPNCRQCNVVIEPLSRPRREFLGPEPLPGDLASIRAKHLRGYKSPHGYGRKARRRWASEIRKTRTFDRGSTSEQ